MVNFRVSLLLLLVGFAVVASRPKALSDDKVLVCYFGSWAVYRPGAGKFDVEDIDPYICTHVIYEFAGLSATQGTIISLDRVNDLDENHGKGAFTRFTKLKEKNPDLKTLLAIGGWNEASKKYSDMVSNTSSRKTFLGSAVKFLNKYNFDGLDFDWQYPTQNGGKPEDKENFVTFLSEMRTLFDLHGLMMTAAVSAEKGIIDSSYDIPAMAKYLDHIHVMCHDYHDLFPTYCIHNSPLFEDWVPEVDKKNRNANFSINYWIQNGAPAEKLVMGVGLHGRTFTLSQEDKTDPYAPASGPGTSGPYTREAGFIGYNEICDQRLTHPRAWSIEHDEYIIAPYTYNENQWISYEDQESIKIKTRFAVNLGLKGVMAWSIETDDFHGECHGVKFPLLTAILDGLNGGYVPIPPSEPTQGPRFPTTTTTTHHPCLLVVPKSVDTYRVLLKPSDEICKHAGNNPLPNEDCAGYYFHCEKDDSGDWQISRPQACSDADQVFDPVSEECTSASNVPACLALCVSEISTSPIIDSMKINHSAD
ncbi:probable chitinase 2 [Ischnura elegans]|uniref:probable chitinase 2 n=1 Tax=Ischnura elegans TaxID=197161 RepID=UPI001ED8BD14|nr:probable chitinase 2 [Ischnura elegans]